MKRESIEEIAVTGDNLETLRALRQKLATTLDKSESGRDIASLSRQLQTVMNQIADLESQHKSNDELLIDELIKERQSMRVRSDRRRAQYYSTDDEEYSDEDEE